MLQWPGPTHKPLRADCYLERQVREGKNDSQTPSGRDLSTSWFNTAASPWFCQSNDQASRIRRWVSFDCWSWKILCMVGSHCSLSGYRLSETLVSEMVEALKQKDLREPMQCANKRVKPSTLSAEFLTVYRFAVSLRPAPEIPFLGGLSKTNGLIWSAGRCILRKADPRGV
jgi:hypothetical protein